MKPKSDILYAFSLVRRFFKGDLEKTLEWWSHKNVAMGGCSTSDMVSYGKAERLIRFIEEQLYGQ